MQVPVTLQAAQEKAARDARKPTRLQRTAVRQALDSWVFENYGYLHRRLFLPATRDKLADACTAATDYKTLMIELNNTRFCLRESALHCNIESLLETIRNTLQDISPAPDLEPTQEISLGASSSHPTFNSRESTGPSMRAGIIGNENNEIEQISVLSNLPGLIDLESVVLTTRQVATTMVTRTLEPERQPMLQLRDAEVFRSLVDNPPLELSSHEPLPTTSEEILLLAEEPNYNTSIPIACEEESLPTPPTGPPLTVESASPLLDTTETTNPVAEFLCVPSDLQLEILQGSICPQPTAPVTVKNSTPSPTIPTRLLGNMQDRSLLAVQEQPSAPEITIPLNLPPGVTPEMYLCARQSVMSNVVLSSHLQVPPTLPVLRIQRTKPEPCASTEPGASHDKPINSSQRKRKQRTNDPIEAARRNIELRASQVENNRRKKAMKRSSTVSSKGADIDNDK